ncbi:alpha/beta fold hydrolase [Amycolatopsis suaedae]|uniref:Alpha/beta hydrolase n=1 Tax=Amycolatopsis suaedae TaxID=2510978 RepID=A0A4Q7JAD1_9PSEU|nr:alpha/beta hydrolase [Amycolatopsis suaedae]RZQ64217.1 alpha/beta hydrolase [Amycolatopsis suaedae]
MERSVELGKPAQVDLPQGTVRYFERGTGRPVVFVHGLLVNAELWRKVVPGIAEGGYRCIAPDLPLGSHETPMSPEADLSPTGVADLIADFLAALDLDDVTIVANDTGGGLTQILLTRRSERIGRVVLTPSDSFERFFPPPLASLPKLARLPGSMWLTARLIGSRLALRVLFGLVTKRPIPGEIAARYTGPMRRSAGVQRDLRKFVTGVHNRYTLAAAELLPKFDRPVLLAWAREDKLFPLSLAQRLIQALPDARLREIGDTLTFVPEDRPDELVRLVLEFLDEAGTAD